MLVTQQKTIDQVDAPEVLLARLKAAGLKEPSRWRRFETKLLIAAVSLASLIFLGINLALKEPKWLESSATVITWWVFVVGYRQWRAARHEISFDKFYERLDIANRKFDAWQAQPGDSKAAEKTKNHLYTMFVFAELDNLEYVLEKFKLGYVTLELVERAVRTFKSRCDEAPSFCERALWCLEKASGYEETTRELVRKICLDRLPQQGNR